MAYNYYPYLNHSLQMPQPQQTQNSGCVFVRNEQEARNYPVAYGNSVVFRDENAPCIYVKTMGFSQSDRPMFEKYVRAQETPQNASQTPAVNESDTVDMEKLQKEIEAIRSELEALKKKTQIMEDKEGV